MPQATAAPTGGQGSFASAVEDSAIDQLSATGGDEPGPYDDEPTQEGQDEGDAEPGAEPGEAEVEEGDEPAQQEALDPELVRLAEERGINPKDLEGLTIAQIVQKLTASAKEAAPAAETKIDWMEGLDAPKQEGTLPEETKPAGERPKEETRQKVAATDIGANWESQEDSVKDLNEAFAEGQFDKVAEIQNAIFLRQFAGMGQHMVEQMLTARLQEFRQELDKQFGDVVPRVQRDIAREQFRGDRDWALDQIRKADKENSALLEALFKEKDGEVVEFNGQEWPATPYNKILAENDWMLNIKVEDGNPRVAQRKTIHKRLSAVLSRFREMQQAGNLKADKAKELVETGKQIERRKQDDRVRQGLNAGKGASSTGGKPPRNVVHDLNSIPGRGSIEELMGT